MKKKLLLLLLLLLTGWGGGSVMAQTFAPAIPANPTADDWYDCGNENGYSAFYFTLPTTDVDGNDLDPEKLSYSIYTDDDQLFTFDVEHYYYDLNANMTEIPYWIYSDGYDFYRNHVYFYRTNRGDNPLFTNRIGIQVHYTVNDVKNSSDIVYWGDLLIYSSGVPANPTADDWYDCGDESGFSKFYFTLPTTDVDGNPLDPECLSFSIYTDEDQLFTFDVEHYYYNIVEDMTEIPYSIYTSGYDFNSKYVYLYRTNAEGYDRFFENRIGIQVYYTVDGVKNSSEIVYYYESVPQITLQDKDDNSGLLKENDNWKVHATIEGRTIYTDGRWNTLCLPFNLSAKQIEESPLAGFEVKELDTEKKAYDHITGYEAESKTLWLNFKEAESIVAGKPYIVRMPEPEGTVTRAAAGITDPTFEGVIIKNGTPAGIESEDKTVTFQGVYTPLPPFESENRSVLFLQNNSLYYPDGTAPTTVNAFRAYFPLNGIHGGDLEEDSHPVRSFVLNFGDGNATAVEMVNGEIVNGKSDAWYDLSGRKLNQKPAHRGIYINNGRKVLVNDNK